MTCRCEGEGCRLDRLMTPEELSQALDEVAKISNEAGLYDDDEF